jgi:hypothetical protein
MILRIAAALALAALPGAAAAVENLILVMTDGLRTQEVFRGPDASLMEKGAKLPFATREALLPFVWGVMGKQGQIFGNRAAGSEAILTNGLNFSYPGYSETLCGFPDPRIKSNDPVPNPNVTVLEWLHSKPGFQGKVAAFGAWDAIGAIVNGKRGGFIANSGYEALQVEPPNERIAFLNRLKMETRYWPEEAFDAFVFHTALEYLKAYKPRVLYLSLGETDEYAHAGKYDHYLRSAHLADSYLKELWDTVQAMPEYAGKTALVFVTDHGRGEGPAWKDHGEETPDSKWVWMAFLGPGVAAKGERKDAPTVTQSQVAATIAALLGEDYSGAVEKAGKPIPLE